MAGPVPPEPGAPPTPPEAVDPRILQANERTLLAWLRTGMGLMAFGFVLARAGAWVHLVAHRAPTERGPVVWLGLTFIAAGSVFCALSAVQYTRVRRAILAKRPILVGRLLAPALAVLLMALGLALALIVALH